MDIVEISKWFGAIAVIVSAVILIWKTVFKPLRNITKQATKFAEALPVLLSISDQFKNNGGNTLRDKIDNISTLVDSTRASAETAKTVAETNAAIVAEISNVHSEQIAEIRTHINEKHEENVRTITQLQITAAGMAEKVNGIDDRLDSLTPFIVRNRSTDQ